MAGDQKLPLPIYIKLSEILSVLDESQKTFSASVLIELIIKWSENNFWEVRSSVLKKLFERRQLTILLDGLDEIDSTKDRRRISKVIQHASDYLNTLKGPRQIIMTSRSYAYNDCKLNQPFVEVEIEDMSRDQIEKFTELWCKAVHDVPINSPIREHDKAKNEFISLKNALWANEQFRVLTKTPVLLAIMAAIHHRHGHLSGVKGESL